MVNIPFGIPEIYETEAKGRLHLIYEDIKFVLKVPIVNFVFRTLAHYEKFLQVAWNQVRPNMLTSNLEQAAQTLRYPETSFKAPEINWERHYSKETIESIRRIVFTFNYVNTKLLLITTAWEESLGYRPIDGRKPLNGFIQPGIIQGLPSINLINIPQAPSATRELILEIMKKKRSYDAASDYRSLANYPTFLEITWNHLKDYLGSDEYILVANNVRSKARELVHDQMPYPVTISPESLYSIYSPREIAGIMGIISMFSSFISDLIVDGALFRKFF